MCCSTPVVFCIDMERRSKTSFCNCTPFTNTIDNPLNKIAYSSTSVFFYYGLMILLLMWREIIKFGFMTAIQVLRQKCLLSAPYTLAIETRTGYRFRDSLFSNFTVKPFCCSFGTWKLWAYNWDGLPLPTRRSTWRKKLGILQWKVRHNALVYAIKWLIL